MEVTDVQIRGTLHQYLLNSDIIKSQIVKSVKWAPVYIDLTDLLEYIPALYEVVLFFTHRLRGLIQLEIVNVAQSMGMALSNCEVLFECLPCSPLVRKDSPR